MAKYVPDVISHRWVIISPGRLARPESYAEKKTTKRKNTCPFCTGNEAMSPPEVFRYGKGSPGKPGWDVRIIPNKFPITDYHEVIIHSPNCDHDLEELPLSQTKMVLRAYRERFNYYRTKGQVLIFANHGEHAGASLKHPHSQLVVIPEQINLDALTKEPLNNIVEENTFFNTYCPDFSQWPYEVWIAPKKDNGRFGDLDDEQLDDFSGILHKTLKQLRHIFDRHKISSMPFGYNYYIYPHHNWYLRIIPRFVHRAGFELGTGLNVNIVDPIDASLELRGVESRMMSLLTRLKKGK